MARKAYVPGLAVLLVALVPGCTAGGGEDGSTADAKPGSPTASAPLPGRYRTLPEPCGSVPRSALKELLPGVETLPRDQQETVYRGTPAVTYDTDRRVGCSWRADGSDASHQLAIDVERVVSYDAAVSDDSQAQEVYAQKEKAADLPSPAPSGTVTAPPSGPVSAPSGSAASDPAKDPSKGSPEDPADDPAKDAAKSAHSNAAAGSGPPARRSGAPAAPPSTGASPSTSASPGTPSGDSSDPGLDPRLLNGLGNAAFLNDVLSGPGSATQNRTVSVVFRTSNVIVTVRYTEQPSVSSVIPDSKELQEKAQGLAQKLAERLNE
ncbi:DUF3558 domain-containing protein [Streptomyces sp. NPDC088725]|uniref:DUF3558 domain-containing protein n=1 Tax=Streptomyces sp. NPDC088725 TaxID=3365873 RepID=UPI00381E326E